MNEQRSSNSIAGPKPKKFWALIISGNLIVSLGVITGIITLLQWYKVPKGAEVLLPRLIISAIVIVIALTAIATLIHFVYHYRTRYHLHRDRGLIRDLYPNRDRLKAHYKKVLFDANRKFRVIGISLHTLLSEPKIAHWIQQILSQKSDLQIYLCFLKPYSEFVKQRETIEHRFFGRISHDCLHNLHKALDIKKDLGNNACRFHVYQINTVPVAFLLQRDSEIYFEPYLAKEVGRTFPTFVMARNENNSEAFDKFIDHIDTIIAEGVE